MNHLLYLCFCVLLLTFFCTDAPASVLKYTDSPKDTSILILGGGVTGIIAARTLSERGFNNFRIIEAKSEFGGRMQSQTIGGKYVVEEGAGWIHGTQSEDGGFVNPIFELAQKHGISTQRSDITESLSFFDENGETNFMAELNESRNAFSKLVSLAGSRQENGLSDISSREGFSMIGSTPKTPTEKASEYFLFDWECAQTPEQSSLSASTKAFTETFVPEEGGFSDENLLCVDQRGFKTLIQSEANSFLSSDQILLNSVVDKISYSETGVQVLLTDGRKMTADYALITFSVGVLQNDDVSFDPKLPDWKYEAIHSIKMSTFTKIFLQFPEKFWFDTEYALYADSERGKYAVWQNLDHEDFLPGSRILVTTLTGDYAERVESLTDSQIQTDILDTLQKMYPNTTIPDPLDFVLPKWHSDPLFRGSYSNMPTPYLPIHQENLRAVVNDTLWFAGEATSQRYYGFLHGAYTEALNVAIELANHIESKSHL